MSAKSTIAKLAKEQAIHDISVKRAEGTATHEDFEKLEALKSAPVAAEVAAALPKPRATRRFTANVWLDNSDPNAFYLIVAAGSTVWSVFEFNPATCTAADKSGNRMLMSAARGLLRDKSTLTKLASYRLERSDMTPGCLFHADNFGPVFASLAVAFTALMPKPASANTTVSTPPETEAK